MRIRVLDRFWNVEFVSSLGRTKDGPVHGQCDPPTAKNKTIRIWRGSKGEELLSTAIHEFLHAAGWHLDEDHVHDFGDDLARFLTRLGYVKEETD